MIKPTIDTQELQERIGHRAKSALEHRFWGLHVHLEKLSTLAAAYTEAMRNGGAPGSDGETFEAIERRGRQGFLMELVAELRNGTYRPRAYRRRSATARSVMRARRRGGYLEVLTQGLIDCDFAACSSELTRA